MHKKERPPYASIPTSLLATKRVRSRTGMECRLYLWANANLKFKPKPGEPRLLLLNSSDRGEETISRILKADRRDVSRAKAGLIEAELLTCTKAAIRPGRSGSAGGAKAAEYDLPHRKPGCQTRFDAGDPKFDGHFRILSDDLRCLTDDLNNNEARVLVGVVLPQHRNDKGAVQMDRVCRITVPAIVAAFANTPKPINKRTAGRALDGLEAKGLVRKAAEASGRRPASYVPAGVAADGVPRKPRG